MTDLQKPKIDCPCGCGAFGLPRRDGHPKACACTSCARAQRTRSAVKAHQRIGRRLARSSSSSEESWRGALRYELKTDAARAGMIVNAWRRTRDQAPRVIGDPRPFALVAQHDGAALVVVELEVLAGLLAEAAS